LSAEYTIPASAGTASGDEGSKALSLLNALSPSYGFCKSFDSFAIFAAIRPRLILAEQLGC
jgi:hypothetical protein